MPDRPARKCRDWRVALQELLQADELGIQAPVALRNSVATACELGRRWQWVLQLLRDGSRQSGSHCVSHKAACDLITYNAGIRAARHGRKTWVFALQLLQEAQDQGIQPDAIICSDTIGVERSHQSWTTMLQLIALLRRSPSNGRPLPVTGFLHAMLLCRELGRWRLVQHFLGELTVLAGEPNTIVCGVVAGACCSVGHWRRSAAVLRAVDGRSAGQQCDIVTLCTLAASCVDSRAWFQAFGILEQACCDGRFMPSIASIEPAITAPRSSMHVAASKSLLNIASAAWASMKHWRQSISLLDVGNHGAMKTGASCPEDVVAWNSAMGVCAAGPTWRVTLRLFTQLVAVGHVRNPHSAADAASYGAAIVACATGHHSLHAGRLLTDMRRASLEPDTHSQGAAVQAFAHDAQWRQALDILRAGEQHVDEQLLGASLRACGHAIRWRLVLEVFTRYCRTEGQCQGKTARHTEAFARTFDANSDIMAVVTTALMQSGSPGWRTNRVFPTSSAALQIASKLLDVFQLEEVRMVATMHGM